MHPQHAVDEVRRLFASGRKLREIALLTGVPERTVRHWCSGDRRSAGSRASRVSCPRCGGSPLHDERYAYLLGSYLGDGHITVGLRASCLWIYCSDDWPGIREEVHEALRAVMPASSVSVAQRTGCVALKSYSTHWTCLFPQHGPGKKHMRPIVLAPWQHEIVRRHPGQFLRGLFHSDGCRVTNWTRGVVGGEIKRYEYPRYQFSNKSTDILGLCAAALDQLGIAHRRPRWDTISVARRGAVAALDEFVGPKS